jgi:signal transduction histidine kinase/DNA-binding response OmpR family regulator
MLMAKLTIKRKLMLIAMVTSSLALLLASAGFVVYDLTSFRTRLNHDLTTQAEIIASNSMAALAFQDEPTTREILSALRAKDDIVVAAIYAPDGRLFTSYRREADGRSPIPARPGAEGTRQDGESLKVFRAIALHDQLLGTLYIESDMRLWRERLISYTGIVGILMCGAALVAFLLSSRLQRVISEPILALEQSMRTVTAEKSFTLRVRKTHDDEIGALIDGFNTMLAELHQRDVALRGANEALTARTTELEQEVAERLRVQRQLTSLNVTLEERVAERSAAAEQRAAELARSKEALEKQTRILQSILDSMSDGVIVADETGRIIVFNPAAAHLLRVAAGDTLTRDWTLRHGVYLRDMVTEYPNDDFPLRRAVRGEAVRGDLMFVLGDQGPGQGIWLSVDATPLTGEDGVVHNGVAIFRNITASKRAEEALLKAKDAAEAANRSKSQFLANMSHELRTPLNAIIGYSEILQDYAHDSGDHEPIADLQKIHTAGRHLQSLIDHILDLSKIEAGKMELVLETFDVAQLVTEVTATVQTVVERNGNGLRVSCSGDLGYMRADMTKVRQVLFNLLSNAGKFTENGAVTVDVSRSHHDGRDWMRFVVADTGIGMTGEQASRLFEDFTQVDASTTRKYGGTGLGLAISRRFCEMMGGRIGVDSELGRGSRFWFELPVKIERASEAARQPADGAAAASAATRAASSNLVLVIEDDPIAQDVISRLLAKEGLDVVTASSGAEGLALARELRPAAITLDVIMPHMDGWAVLAQLKDCRDVADIPVVMVTMTDDRHTGFLLGAADYLTKPVEPARLAAVLARHVQQGATVLVVDDDESARGLTARQLRMAGWSVREAEHGVAALAAIEHQAPDLIILDLMMPEMDGFGLLDALRQRDLQAIPVVVVTAKDLTEKDRQALNGSVGDILQKSTYRREDLLSAVRQQLKRVVAFRPAA